MVAVVLFPFLAALSIWLYVVIFIFTGLWFQYYCLQALADLRAGARAARTRRRIVCDMTVDQIACAALVGAPTAR